ncbi:hypothetical protein AJ87_19370 [Rhizobium yanglingense]|nr:hypothetical protein AJ87_19370 [Rhizobium yanglingense]
MVAGAFRLRRQDGKFAGTLKLLGERQVKACRTPAMASGLKARNRLNGFAGLEALPVFPCGRRIGDVERLAPQPLSCKLTVESAREFCCFCVEFAGFARPAGFCGTAQPIPGPRNGNRTVRNLKNLAEMRLGRRRILQSAQRIPAGVEFGFDNICRVRRDVVGDDAVGGLELALVDKAAADDALLVPPFAGIHQFTARRRHLRQKLGGFGIFVLLAQIFDAGKQIAWVFRPFAIDGIKERAGIGRLARDRRPCLVEGLRLAQVAEALGLRRPAAIHQIFHARLVVGGAEQC